MKKSKVNITKTVEVGNPDFDWSIYEYGFTGANLVVNPSVQVKSKVDKVYSQENYAQDLYKLMSKGISYSLMPKDLETGMVYTVTDMYVINDHEIGIITDNGVTDVVDLIKEHAFLDSVGSASIEEFISHIADKGYLKKLIDLGIKAKVVEHGRMSLSDGMRSGILNEFMEEVRTNACKYAYDAHIKEINGGGYIVDICGINCFLPGSLAAAGIITDFTSMLGKTIPVMVVNYLPNSGFVVSYKKYLNTILPAKIENELEVGMRKSVKVTGSSKNGLFVTFKDKDGEYVFTGLVHRSVMSKDFEIEFDRHYFRQGDEFWAYINSITEFEGGYRVVFSDLAPEMAESSEEKK